MKNSTEDEPKPNLISKDRSEYLRRGAYIIPLTFGIARIVVDKIPDTTYENEFW